jgi:pyruvate/2-oxoacid:ferredoxin oxidoreductase beta subunit
LKKHRSRDLQVEDYLKKQRRFRHLTGENIQVIQEQRNREGKLIREKWLEE